MSKTWISVAPKLVNIPERKKVNGVDVTISLPPYDVPLKATSYMTDDGAVFEFKYRSDDFEKLTTKTHNGVTILYGKKSHRVKEIRMSKDLLQELSSRAGKDASTSVHEFNMDHIDDDFDEVLNLSAAERTLENYRTLIDNVATSA